jgi:acyl-CoA dehydrogenase
VNFDFSEDEKLVRDQAARFLDDHCDTRVVRKVLEGTAPYAREVWKGLADMGLTGTAIPEAFGGAGAGHLPLCLVAQQLGAHVAPTPFGSSIYLAAEALNEFGTQAQKEAWLPRLAAGKAIGTLAADESIQATTPATINTSATNGRLDGRKLVADGGLADVAIVLAREKGGEGLYLVELGNPSVARERVETVDPTRDTAFVTFTGSPAERLGDVEGWSALARVHDRAAVLYAFEQVGGAQAALDMAVGYAHQRYAFGRPIGTFQALKHMMADMYVALKLAESNCYYAAWALATDAPVLPLAAATARVSATQAYQLCSRDNIQVHGGMGFTWEFDCHLYYRRSNYLALQLGGQNVWEEKLVNALPLAS